jgi:hypothetical protein
VGTLLAQKIKGNSAKVTVMTPVSSVGYVNRLNILPSPLDAKRYGPRNRSRDQLIIFIVCKWPFGHGQLCRTIAIKGGDI